jgi:hypothetical protein
VPLSYPSVDQQSESAKNGFLRQSAQVFDIRGGVYIPPNASANTQTAVYNTSVIPPIGEQTGDAVMPDFTREEHDAKLAAVAAQTDTKIARVEGKIETMTATIVGKLDTVDRRLAAHSQDRNLIIGTIGLGVLAVIGAFIALATYGDALFGRGMNVRDVVQAVLKEQQVQRPEAFTSAAIKRGHTPASAAA